MALPKIDLTLVKVLLRSTCRNTSKYMNWTLVMLWTFSLTSMVLHNVGVPQSKSACESMYTSGIMAGVIGEVVGIVVATSGLII